MIQRVFITLLCAGLLAPLPAAEIAAPAANSADPIGALVRQIQAERAPQEIARADAPRPTASQSPLERTYELLARNLTRAALSDNRAMLNQTRERIEEMLRAMLTQAAFETGRFQSQLSREACNYWGMKDRKDVASGRIHYKGEYYESFPSMYEGCRGYMQFLARDRYAGVVAKSHDKAEFLRDLCRRGWCPDANYVDLAMSVYKQDRVMIDRAAQIAVEELIDAARKA